MKCVQLFVNHGASVLKVTRGHIKVIVFQKRIVSQRTELYGILRNIISIHTQFAECSMKWAVANCSIIGVDYKN